MKRFMSILLALAMTITISAAAVGTSNNPKVSDWAAADLKRSEALGLVSDRLGSDYTQPITRLQFAELAVNFAENITGNPISVNGITFEDTTDYAALEAAAAGIVKGTGNGSTFSPNSLITREEIATMIYRTIQYVDQTALKPAVSLDEFADAEHVSDWAVNAIGSVVAAGIMKGVSATELLPKGNTSIEQAILLIYRSYVQEVGSLTISLAEQYADDQRSIQGDLQKQYVGAESTAVTFTDSRVNTYRMVEVYSDVSGHSGTYLLFTLDYSLMPDHPENILTVGGIGVDADGWMTVGLPTTLALTKTATGFEIVGGFVTEFTPDGNAEIFRSDFEQWLAEEAS